MNDPTGAQRPALAGVRRLRRAARRLRTGSKEDDAPQFFPPGAFYSPVVNIAEVFAEPDRSRLWPAHAADPSGFDCRGPEQLALLRELAAYPMPSHPSGPGLTYDPDNDQFPPQDAALLYAMLRHLRPRRMVEVGCGWSTIVATLAVEDGELGTQLTCIDPYPRDFVQVMDRIRLRAERVEHTPMTIFDELGAGDVLFIDSSHVAKTGSDVVHQVLNVLPRLQDGVVVHVHDIFIPEDYPEGWVHKGFGWNEQYLLHAFLVGNSRAHVLAMNHWLSVRHPDAITEAFGAMPFHGSSVWFRIGA